MTGRQARAGRPGPGCSGESGQNGQPGQPGKPAGRPSPVEDPEAESIEDRRRAQIMAAAKRLFFERGFAGTSMGAVAAEAGVSKGLIYHYFESKEDLLLSFAGELDAYLRALREAGEGDPAGALRRFGEDFLANGERAYEDVPPIQVLLISFADQDFDVSAHPEHNPILKDFGRGYLGAFFQRGMEKGVFRHGDARAFGDIYWSFLVGKLLLVKKGNESLGAAVYVDEALSAFEGREKERGGNGR